VQPSLSSILCTRRVANSRLEERRPSRSHAFSASSKRLFSLCSLTRFIVISDKAPPPKRVRAADGLNTTATKEVATAVRTPIASDGSGGKITSRSSWEGGVPYLIHSRAGPIRASNRHRTQPAARTPQRNETSNVGAPSNGGEKSLNTYPAAKICKTRVAASNTVRSHSLWSIAGTATTRAHSGPPNASATRIATSGRSNVALPTRSSTGKRKEITHTAARTPLAPKANQLMEMPNRYSHTVRAVTASADNPAMYQ